MEKQNTKNGNQTSNNAIDRVQIDADSSGLQISYNGVVRLQGGRPYWDGELKNAAAVTINGGDLDYKQGNKNHVVHSVLETDSAIAAFFLTFDGDHGEGSEPLGLAFAELPGLQRGIAYERYKPYNSWTKPIRFHHTAELPDWDVQFVFWQYDDGLLAAAIPLCGGGFRTTLGQVQGALVTRSESYAAAIPDARLPQMAIGFGTDLYALVEQLYKTGLRLMQIDENHVSRKRLPKIFERIGWCTWNASELGAKLNEEHVLQGTRTFTDAGFPLGWVLIDDGWLQSRDNKLCSFDPDPSKFPQGFGPLVNRLKRETGIREVGIWHAADGHWDGIEIDSELGRRVAQDLFQWTQTAPFIWKGCQDKICHFLRPDSGALRDFYMTWHELFRKQGISFVKVDNQIVAERLSQNNFPIWQMAKAMHGALNESIEYHFGGTVINCMDMSADACYLFGKTAVGRGVEDYFPFKEDETYDLTHGNAAAHVLQAITNCLYFSQMVFSDFDMFQTHHPHAVFHAIARALHNGPIYLTDVPGEQNFDVLWPLIAADGRILRPDTPLLPSPECLFQVQDPLPFKAFSFSNGVGLLGIWNCADADRVKGSFSTADLPGLTGREFAVFDYFAQKVIWLTAADQAPVELDRMGVKLYWFAPAERGVAPLGLLGKYNAPKTLASVDWRGKSLFVKSIEGGELGIACRQAPKSVRVDGRECKFSHRDGLLRIDVPMTGSACELELAFA
ncbi:MAG TPA: Sip1-related alpha-galactosidase [bacterium]|nr:Sip1-related alpha-galactosidase [bacterium]HPG46137.1 Sip1-related alpha-galactosidase [bacterium]HPM98234.1 Sip1-related alpha-galactosidase [bacterium]